MSSLAYILSAAIAVTATSCSTRKQNETSQWRTDIARIVDNNKNGIPIYLLEASDYPYGAYFGKPRKIGTLTTKDMAGLAQAPEIHHFGETQDYWYSLTWDLPPGSPSIDISMCPYDGFGIVLSQQNLDSIQLDDKHLHTVIKKMLPATSEQ